MEMTARTNLRAVLPTIRVPTLVLHVTGDRVGPGRRLGAALPDRGAHALRGVEGEWRLYALAR